MTGKEKHAEGVELISQAFERAREAGSVNPGYMTAAVLKNRLLDLTDRQFDESEWGAASIKQFVEQFDDVIEFVPDLHPPQLRLRSGGSTEESPPRLLGSRQRIRKDLWDAVLDYSGDSKYVWDPQRAIAVEVEEPPQGNRLLPTLSEEEFTSWRSDFVNEASKRNSWAASLLYKWLEQEQPLSMLPRPLRVSWVIELKCRVLERLESWFENNKIPKPQDLIVSESQVGPRTVEIDDLRERVIEVVREMSRAELEALKMPATALMRGKR